MLKYIEITDSFVSKKLSFERFAELQNKINNIDDDICLMLNIEKRLGLNFAFLFSTLPFLSEKFNKKIYLKMNPKTFYLFQKIGFFENIEHEINNDYCQQIKDESNIIQQSNDVFKIVTEITKEAPVKMSDKLSAIFISKIGEMYNNAIEHSEGIVLGTKYFKLQKNIYNFSCYDTGVGIPQKVISTINNIESNREAFEWAMTDGNSTIAGVPRGLGLGLLKSFVQANDGRIRVCSGNVLYEYSRKKGKNIIELNNQFYGTLFEMDIISDNDYEYVL